MIIALYILITIFVGLLLTAGVLGYHEWRKVDTPGVKNKDLQNTTKLITISHPIISKLYDQYSMIMIGQQDVFVGLMGCYLAGGHCLLTGHPGTGKTLAVKTFTHLMGVDMGRVQGTSDLLPADIVGSLIYNPKTSEFDTVFGPIMHECVLVDEINRMPSKTQSALLQAMAEGNIVVGQETYGLPDQFMVIATQNPHDRVGTFPLPQAQLDRFMCEVVVQAPGLEEQSKILGGKTIEVPEHTLNKLLISDTELIGLHEQYHTILVPSPITSSVAQLIQDKGLSSRAGQQLISFARAIAQMQDRNQVEHTDIDYSLRFVTKHRK